MNFKRDIIWVSMRNHFDNERCFSGFWQLLRSKKFSESSLCIIVSIMGEFVCAQCYNMQLCGRACQFWILWFFFFCYSISSTCFCFVALLFLWRRIAFVFCMPSSSDLLWPPSAREHSADPSGKVCTLDLQWNPSPVSSCSTVLSHQGCTVLQYIFLKNLFV